MARIAVAMKMPTPAISEIVGRSPPKGIPCGVVDPEVVVPVVVDGVVLEGMVVVGVVVVGMVVVGIVVVGGDWVTKE